MDGLNVLIQRDVKILSLVVLGLAYFTGRRNRVPEARA